MTYLLPSTIEVGILWHDLLMLIKSLKYKSESVYWYHFKCQVQYQIWDNLEQGQRLN